MVRLTFLSLCCSHLSNSVVDKSQGRGRESNPGPLGEKRENLCLWSRAVQAPKKLQKSSPLEAILIFKLTFLQIFLRWSSSNLASWSLELMFRGIQPLFLYSWPSWAFFVRDVLTGSKLRNCHWWWRSRLVRLWQKDWSELNRPTDKEEETKEILRTSYSDIRHQFYEHRHTCKQKTIPDDATGGSA